MKKRATSLLLTLFLLLTSTHVWAQYVTGITVAETSFETKTGSYPCKISEIKCKNPSNESYATSLQYVTSGPSQNGTYTINNGNLIIKQNQTGDQNIVLAGNFSGLVSASGYNNYKITIKLGKSNGDDYEVRCKTYYNGNDNNEVNKGPGSTITIDATCVGGSVSFTMFFNWINNGTLTIESISVVGASEKKIISSESPAVCSGKETTLSGLGSTSTSYQWSVSDDNVNYTPIPGATQSTYTVSVTEPKYYKLNDIPGTLVYPVLCCSDNTVGANISETFKMSTASTAFEDLSGLSRIDNNSYTHASSSPIGDGFYAIVHKAKDGGHWSNSPVQAKSLTIDSKDGFLLVNCSKSDHGKAMYMRLFDNLCPNTLYKFSASVANIDMKASDLGIDVKFDVIAKEGPKNGLSLLPEPISVSVACGNSSWIDKSISFVTTDCRKVEVRLYNNVENPTGKGGNDVGLDDIIFGLCTPEIALYSNDAWTAKDREICPDDEPNTYISVGSAMNLDDILPGQKYYYFEYKDGNNWKPVAGNNPTTDNKIKVDIQETTHASGMLYRAWVAGDATTVVDAAKGNVTNTCTAYAQSDAITLTYKCAIPSVESKAPEMNNYLECPTATNTIDLKTLIKKVTLVDGTEVNVNNIAASGTLKWYDANDVEITNTVVNFPAQGQSNTYKVSFTQKDDATSKYRESKKTTFTVGIKETIVAAVSPTDISGCLSEISQDVAGRTFYVTKVNPEASPANDYTYTWKKVKSDGTEESTPLKKGDENFYGLPTAADAGKINLYVESKSNVACPSVAKELTYNIADNPNFDCSISVPCNSQLSTTGIIINLTNISGSTALTIKRDGTEIKSETLTAGSTSYTYTDTNVAATATSVEYEVILGAGSCSKNFKETYNISAVNQFSLTSNATDIKESAEEIEYHICEGTESTKNTVTVTAGYDLKPGELFEWYVNDVKDEAADGNDKNYTLTGLTKETKFKAVIVAEAGAATCGGEAEITIYVDKKPIVTVENKTICIGESTSFTASNVNYDSYQWTPTDFLSDPDKATTSVNKPTGSKTYSLKVVDGVCFTLVEKIKLTVNPLPTINSVDVQTKDNGERNITIIADGEDPLTYSLDNVNFDGPEEIINKVSIGWNLLYLKDGNGCKDTLAFKIDPIEIIPDKYFTPNGDNNHEKWTVKNLDTYDSYIVEIFDRYGKRLYIKRVGSFKLGGSPDDDASEAFEGWDGIYNGHPMPSDDYWYLITVEEIRKQYTGHFTLKR